MKDTVRKVLEWRRDELLERVPEQRSAVDRHTKFASEAQTNLEAIETELADIEAALAES